jgi:hypothetical protein
MEAMLQHLLDRYAVLTACARFLTVSILVLLLQACGGGASGTNAAGDVRATAFTLVATVQNCEAASVQDSGRVVYVLMAASCAATPATRGVSIGPGPSVEQALSLTRRVGAIDTTAVEIAGLGSRQVQLVQRGQWRQIPHTGTWAPRDGAGLLRLGDALYLLGGWLHGPVTNEVWKTVDLVNWEFLGYAPWPARHGSGWLVHDNRLWVIGGDLYNDVWSSPDGVQWTQEALAAPFGARYTPNAASINGEIFVYAGLDWPAAEDCPEQVSCARGLRSVWKSRDGRDWQLATPEVPWQGRALVHGSAVYQGQIWMIGGGLKVSIAGAPTVETSAEFTDIWSSADGQTWQRRAETTGFAGRTHFSVLATSEGCYVSDGSVGTQGNVSNGLFYAPDCIRFDVVPVPRELPYRHASSLVEFNSSLVVIGGPPVFDGAGTSVWQYFP